MFTVENGLLHDWTAKPESPRAREMRLAIEGRLEEIGRSLASGRQLNGRDRKVLDKHTMFVAGMAGQKRSCARCGHRDFLTWHHVVPRSHGGPSTPDNLLCLCAWCHAAEHGKDV